MDLHNYVWERQHVLDLKDFHFMFKKRVIDEFLQKWYNDINTCHYLPMLKHYKINFGYEMYLDILPPKLRNILTKLRLSSHNYGLNQIDIIEIEHPEN